MKRLALGLFLILSCYLPSFAFEKYEVKDLNDITENVNSYQITKADFTILGIHYYQAGCDYFRYCFKPYTLETGKPDNFSIDFSGNADWLNDTKREYTDVYFNLNISFDMQLMPVSETKIRRTKFIPLKITNSTANVKSNYVLYDYSMNNAYADSIDRKEFPEKAFGPYEPKTDGYKLGFEAVCDDMVKYHSVPGILKAYAQNIIKLESRALNEKSITLQGYLLDEDGNKKEEISFPSYCSYDIYAVVNSLSFADGTTKTFNTEKVNEDEWVSQNKQYEIIYPWEGKGTSDSPFLIKNANDLLALNTGYKFIDSGFYFKQESDITINTEFWGKPQDKLLLYYYEKPFVGHYDGNGKTISGLTIKTSDKEMPTLPKAPYNDCHGLFHRVRNAEIKNLTINCEINIGENDKAGALAGEAINSTFNNITFSSIINGKDEIGGLVGSGINCNFTNIAVKSNNVTGKKFVGGILGKGEKITADNISIKDSTVNGNEIVGGAFGRLEKNSKVSNVDAEVNVTSAKRYGAGVIASMREYCSANNIKVSGKVTGLGDAGGIFGEIYGNKKKDDKQDVYYNFVSKADVTATKGAAGGIVCYITENASLSDCVNYGTIMGMSSGGIAASIGVFDKYAVWKVTTVARCENHGAIKSTEQVKCYTGGGIVANLRMENTLKDCYNDADVESVEECGGIAGHNDRAYIENCYAIGEFKTEYYDSKVGGITGMFFSPTGPVNSGLHSTIKNCFITNDAKFKFKGKPSDHKNNTNKCCSEEPTYKESYSNLQRFNSASDIKLDSSWNPDVWEIRAGAYPKLKMANALVDNKNADVSNKVEEIKTIQESPVQDTSAKENNVQDTKLNETPKILIPEELELEPQD